MSKGLVKVKLALPDASKILPDGLGAKPVNKQAAKLLFKSDWIYKPMPVDPDLEDRKVVQQYLKERLHFMEEITALKAAKQALIDQSKKLHSQIRELKVNLERAKTGEKVEVPAGSDENGSSLLHLKIQKMTTEELAQGIRATREFLSQFIDAKNFSLRGYVVLRDLIAAMTDELNKRPK